MLWFVEPVVVTFGTEAVIDLKSVEPRASNSAPETVSTAIGTFCKFSSRRWAVTTTSVRPTVSAASAANDRVTGARVITPALDTAPNR